MITSYNFQTVAALNKIDWERVQEKWNASWEAFGRQNKIAEPFEAHNSFIMDAMREQFETLILAFTSDRDSDSLIQQYDVTIKFGRPTFDVDGDDLVGNLVVKSALNDKQFGHLTKKAMEHCAIVNQGYSTFYNNHKITKPTLVDAKGNKLFVGECMHDFVVLQVLPVGNGLMEYLKCNVCHTTASRDVKMVKS
jgi:hypothetical protein